ncbi:MAG: secretin N-terminal domain-containing protein [Pirellulales bacterium]
MAQQAPPSAEGVPTEPPADAATEDSVVKGYSVDDGVDVDRVVADLKKRYVRVPDIKIAADSRTKKVIVVAPANIQADVAQWVPKLAAAQAAAPRKSTAPSVSAPPAANQPMRNAARAAQPAAPHPLKNIAWRELEFGLQKLWGANLPITESEDGQSIVVSFPGRWTPAPTMQVDLRKRVVTFTGAAEAQQSLARLVAALDRPTDTAAADTQILPVTGGNPERVQTAVAALHNALQNDDAAPAKPAPNAPADGPEGSDDSGGDDDNGLIGPVQIEFLDGLDVIVVMGKKRDVDRVTKIIQDIERLTAETKPAVQVYPLQQTNSQAMADLIVQVYTQVLSSRQGAVSITGLVKPNAILLIGRTEAVATVVELIQKLDQPVEPDAMLKVYQLKYMSAPDAETTIRNFFGIRAGGGTGAGGLGQGPLGGGIPGGGGALPGAAGAPGGAAGATSAGVNLAARMNIAIDNRTNSLIIQASPRDLAEIERLLEQIDVEEGAATSELRIFKLSNTLAQDLERVLQGAIRGQATGGAQGGQNAGAQPFGQAQPGGGTGGAANAQGTPRPTNLQFVMVDALQKQVMASGISSDVFVTADVAGNALIVRAPTKSMELIAAIIKELDSLPAAESQIKVFTVTNADATSLTQMLQLLFGQQVTAGRGSGGAFGAGAFAQPLNALAAQAGGPNAGESILVPLRFAVDARTNSIIVSGSAGDLRVVEALLLRLDEGDVPRRRLTVYRLKNALAQDVANTVTQLLQQQRQVINQNQIFNQAIGPFEQLEREFLIQAEPQTNCLVISATPQFYEEIIKMVDDLDFRPPMVMIQVLLAEVQLDNLYELGVELGLQDSLLYDRGRTGVGASNPGFNFNNAGVSSPNLPNNSGASRNALAGQALSNFSLARISPTAGYGGLVLSAASDSVSILVRALQQSGRLQVLSRPQVMAIHNRQAQVVVGQRVPRLSGTTQTTNAVTQNVQDTEIGLILNIIPQINKDGIILMNIQAENSALSQSPQDSLTVPSGDGSVTIPAINTTSAVTTISAKDGQTVVFAGLIQNSKTITTRRVPYLSDIPVLGELFQYNSNQQRRRELLIVMTPKIVQHDDDYDWVKATESERMNWCLSDVVNIHGDVGLRGGSCLMCGDQIPVIYPDKTPTVEYFEAQPREAVPYGEAPTPATSDQGAASTRRQGPTPRLRSLEPIPAPPATGEEPVYPPTTTGNGGVPYGPPVDPNYATPAGYSNPQSRYPVAPANYPATATRNGYPASGASPR